MKLPVKPIYYFLLMLGVTLRLIPYFINRSLWLDEAMLALNIMDRDIIGLMRPLAYEQVAPVLFLFLEKVNIILFGDSEYAFRLLPLIFGILSLPLAYRFTKAISGNTIAALISLLFFATSPLLICFSTELKQYESDVFCTLCLLTLGFDSQVSLEEDKRYMLLAIAGAVLIFMSNITILVLFTIGIYYLVKYRLAIFKKKWLITVFTSWIIAFIINYYFFIYSHPNQDFMLNYWKDSFMPFQAFSGGYWVWMYDKFNNGFEFYPLPFLPLFIICVIIFIVKKQWLFLYFMLFPLLMHFFISGFKLYPFDTRLILYLNAFIIPVIAIGIVELVQAVKKVLHSKFAVAILTIVLVWCLVSQLQISQYPVGRITCYPEEIRESISFINSNKSDGQKVYVYYAAGLPLSYYTKTNRVLFKNDLIPGSTDWDRTKPETCYDEVSKLHGEVWLLFSHLYPDDRDETYTLELFNLAHIPILKSFKTAGSAAYLVKIN